MSSPQATWKQIHLSHIILFDLCLRLEQTKANTKLMHLFIFLCKWYRSRHFVDYLSHTHHLNKKKKGEMKIPICRGCISYSKEFNWFQKRIMFVREMSCHLKEKIAWKLIPVPSLLYILKSWLFWYGWKSRGWLNIL